MKLLTTAILGMLMSGCFAHAHVQERPAHTHSHNYSSLRHAPATVKAWVWVNGKWRRGRWVEGHWTILDVHPRMLNRYPRHYVRFHHGARKPAEPRRPRGHRHPHRHRHRR